MAKRIYCNYADKDCKFLEVVNLDVWCKKHKKKLDYTFACGDIRKMRAFIPSDKQNCYER